MQKECHFGYLMILLMCHCDVIRELRHSSTLHNVIKYIPYNIEQNSVINNNDVILKEWCHFYLWLRHDSIAALILCIMTCLFCFGHCSKLLDHESSHVSESHCDGVADVFPRTSAYVSSIMERAELLLNVTIISSGPSSSTSSSTVVRSFSNIEELPTQRGTEVK